MNVTPDTNVLVRVATDAEDLALEDRRQAARARTVLAAATSVCVTTPTLCEVVWVLRRAYRFDPAGILAALEVLCAGETVVLDRPAVDAGLAMLRAGGDFADGVIAYEGAALGGDVFVSFDRKAVRILSQAGTDARMV